MNKKTLPHLSVEGKRVLMRVDFNVPLDSSGHIADDSRIRATLPSIQSILQRKGKLILMSHLGKPDGKRDPKLSLAVCAKRLSELLHKPVAFASDCVGKEVENLIAKLKEGDVLLLENLRFHTGEEHPDQDPKFVEMLARLGDCYVNDAFGTAHRAHASTALIAKYFPGQSALGFLMEKEISHLAPLLSNPEKPYFALIGGAKVSTKLGVLKSLLPKVDELFIGGGMCFTFLQALGFKVGKSLVESKMIDAAKQLLNEKKIHLPQDLLIADRLDNQANTQTIAFPSNIPEGWYGVDIGEKTINKWKEQFSKAKTFFWNGPVGIFEIPSFAKGTERLAQTLANAPGKVIVGGGDSVAAIEKLSLSSRFYHLSTGGGASLEWIEFGHLPGIDAISSE